MFENQKKTDKMWKSNFVHKSPSHRWFSNGIHSLLKPDGAPTSFTVCDTYRYFVGQA